MSEKGSTVTGPLAERKQRQNILGRFMDKVNSCVLRAGEKLAAEIEEEMKAGTYSPGGKPWDDQSGDARELLSAKAYFVGDNSELLAQRKSEPFPVLKTPRERDGSFTMPTTVTRGVMIVARGESDHNIWLEIAMGSRYSVIITTLHAYRRKILTTIENQMRSEGFL